MKKLFLLTLVTLFISATSFALTPITGPSTVCVSGTIALADTTGGGTWSSSTPTIATVGSSSGIVTGVSAGVATITYTLGTSYVTTTVTVAAGPAAITGGTTPICVGSTLTLADATLGGTWSSYYTWIATVNPSTGVVTGVHGGTATIAYSIGTGCDATTTVTIDATPTPVIAGPTTVCSGSAITLIDSGSTGGTWTSSSTGIATVGSSTGVVTGVSAGTVTITLTATGTCGSAYGVYTVTVLTTTSAGAIVGPSTVYVSNTISLSDPTSSSGPYTWSSSNPLAATIDGSGNVTGIATGSTTITYSVTGCGGAASTTYGVTVTPFDGISGHVNFGSGPYYGAVRVYLITYNPITFDLEAMDSLTAYSSSTSVFYQFTGVPTDSYRVKAAVIDTFGITTTGYIPTYHISHFYWHDADVISHTSGTSDINEDINMSYGTTTSGPGFIGGSVLTGANKGTSGSVPVVGMRMCIINSATSQIQGMAYTNTTGHYTFSNLPVGQTYYVFPDSINYLTTPYTSVTLTTAAPSMSAASFIQHTLSKTITPVIEGVQAVNPSASSITSFPNPANGKLNIQWYQKTNEDATITLVDIAGREVYKSNMKIGQGMGATQIDLSAFTNGIYILSVKSASIDYSNKIQVQH